MTRTKLKDRTLPDYTRGEEIFNMVSHIVGAALGAAALVVLVVIAAKKHDAYRVVGCSIYGASMVLLYTMSSVYHGLRPNMGKKVMQVIDHCTIYFLIGGTYTPIVLGPIREVSVGWAWGVFGVVWGVSAVAVVFTAIDWKKYNLFSMICYLAIGWCILIAIKPTIAAITMDGLKWLLGGGLCYTFGAILYGLGRSHRWMHSIFHLFVVAGSVLQFFCILFYCM